MSAYPATVDQLDDYRNFESLTPPGWSRESKKLRDAEDVSKDDYFGLPASRPHLHQFDDHRSVLRIAEQDLRNIIAVFRIRLPQDIHDRIGMRISVLIDPAEWDIEDEPPNPESFRRLLAFIAAHSELRYPSIFLNRYGLFSASWRPENRSLASLVFHPDNSVNWLVFSPRKDNETDVIKTAGRAPLEDVLKEIGKRGALKWMRRP